MLVGVSGIAHLLPGMMPDVSWFLVALVDFIEDHLFWFALLSFAIVFSPAWYPLLRPPPQVRLTVTNVRLTTHG